MHVHYFRGAPEVGFWQYLQDTVDKKMTKLLFDSFNSNFVITSIFQSVKFFYIIRRIFSFFVLLCSAKIPREIDYPCKKLDLSMSMNWRWQNEENAIQCNSCRRITGSHS